MICDEMKRICLVVLLSVFTTSVLHAQDQADERQKFMFDSVMYLMRDQTIPFMDRYYMTGYIENLLREYQIEILKELLPEAKDCEDKAVSMRLYALIGKFKANLSLFDEAGAYLDSAFQYIDQTDNEVIRGLTYYSAGFSYALQHKITEAHNCYYKAAACFQKKDPRLHILNEVYYNLSLVYGYKNDVTGLEELYNWIKDIAVAFPVQQVLKYTVQARYFRALYNRTGETVYLDSVLQCNRKSFEVYMSEDQPYDVAYQMAENYFLQAEAFYVLQENDSARIHLDKSVALQNPNHLFSKLQTSLLRSRMFFKEGEYRLAETALEGELSQIEELIQAKDVCFYDALSDFYAMLSQIREKQGQIKEALDAERESLKYKLLFAEVSNDEYLQDLRVAHDLDNKQRSINQLTEINKMYARNQILYIGVGLLLVVIIVLTVFLSKRKQRIAQAELKEAKLLSQLEQEKNETLTAKIKENEEHHKLLLSENRLKQINAYLKGLESERLRLSKELHDHIANNILAVNLRLQNEGQVEVVQVSQQLKQIHEQVRNISHELIPPAFTYASFVEILKDYVNQQNAYDKINVALSIDSEEDTNRIPEKICLELYRIIQECIGNALKHSGASNIEILLYAKDNELNLTIIDDGDGFDTHEKKKGIGLIIVHERVKSLHGNIQINSTIGKGTEFTITVPVTNTQAQRKE